MNNGKVNKFLSIFTSHKDGFIWFIALFALLIGTYTWPVFDQDEAAYGGFALHMLMNGDWLIPEFYWSDVHRKTPLHFWLIAGSYKIFGLNEWALRFPALISIIGVAWLVWSMVSSDIGKKESRIALLLISSNLLLGVYARMSVTDAPLLLFQTGAAISLIKYAKRPSFWLAFLHAVLLAIGMLQKGPSILLFSGFLGLLFIVFWRPGRNLLKIQFLLLQLLAFIPIIIWGSMAYTRDGGEMIRWMVDWYILNRVGGSVFGQTGPPGYHFTIMGASCLLVLPLFLKTVYKIRALFNESLYKPYVLWLLAGWIPYEFTASKLPSYALGAYPVAAILMAIVDVNYNIKNKWIQFIWAILVPIVFSFILWRLPYLQELSSLQFLKISFIILSITMLLAIILIKQMSWIKFIMGQIAFYMIGMIGFTWLMSEYFALMPQVANTVKNKAPQKVLVENDLKYYPSLPLYLKWYLPDSIPIILEDNVLKGVTDLESNQIIIISKKYFDENETQWTQNHNITLMNGYNTGRSGIVELVIMQRK